MVGTALVASPRRFVVVAFTRSTNTETRRLQRVDDRLQSMILFHARYWQDVMFKDAEIGELRMKIGHDQRIAEAVATPDQTAFDCLCRCCAQHDVV